MGKDRVYRKPGLTASVAILVLAATAFGGGLYYALRDKSPHYVSGGCQVCHVATDPEQTGDLSLKAGQLELCVSCHEAGQCAATLSVPNENGVSVNLAIGVTHPYGIVPSEASRPDQLPLRDGLIACSTCHDLHMDNAESHMLRLYTYRPGANVDWTPLCADCHPTH